MGTNGNRPPTCHRRRHRLLRSTRAAAVWVADPWVAVHRWGQLHRMLTPRTLQRAVADRRGGHRSIGSTNKVPTHRWEARRERCYSSRTFTRRETFTGGRRCLCRRHRTRRTIGWFHRRRTMLPADRFFRRIRYRRTSNSRRSTASSGRSVRPRLPTSTSGSTNRQTRTRKARRLKERRGGMGSRVSKR